MGRLIGPLFAGCAALFFLLHFARWPETPDGWIHLHRSRALAELIESGVLYPRWFPDFAFGYGHPILHYYAPASYYPPALLVAVGLDPIAANRWSASLIFGLSGWAMYAFLRAALEGNSPNRAAIPAALAGTIVYLAAPYRAYDFAVRGALPEFAAFLWLPILALGVLKIVDPPTGRRLLWRQGQGTVVVGVSLALLALTHNLSAMMAGIGLLTLVPLLLYWSRHRIQSALLFGAGLLLGAALSAWYTVPALLESNWVGIGANPPAFGYANHFATWTSLFQPLAAYAYPSAAAPTVAMPLLALLILIFGLGTLFLPRAERRTRQLLIAGLLLALFSLWLTTASSARVWSLTAPLLGNLQFPWRWQTITTFALGLVTTGGIHASATTCAAAGREQGVAWTLAVTIALAALVATFGNLTYAPVSYRGAEVNRDQMWAMDAGFGQVGATWTGEFLPRWVTEERWAIGRAPISPAPSPAPVEMKVTPRSVGPLHASYATEGDAATLRFRRFYFPSWRIEVDGVPTASRPDGELGLLAVDLPAGSHVVDLTWTATPAMQVGRVLGWLGWFAVALFLLAAMPGRTLRWSVLTVWSLVGIGAVLGQIGPTHGTVAPRSIGVDYGAVRLEAAAVGAAKPGNSLPVHLSWLVRQPTDDLTGFLHLVDGSGAIVAQQDTPLAGAYQPAGRWQPGDLIETTVKLDLPQALPPGTYRLLGGVYPAGSADRPLIPASGGEPRVELTTLEIQP